MGRLLQLIDFVMRVLHIMLVCVKSKRVNPFITNCLKFMQFLTINKLKECAHMREENGWFCEMKPLAGSLGTHSLTHSFSQSYAFGKLSENDS